MGKKWKERGGKKRQRGKKSNDSSDESEPEVKPSTKKAKPPQTTFIHSNMTVLPKVPQIDNSSLSPFCRNFWTGSVSSDMSIDDLKQLRKSIHVLVKGKAIDQCPPPVLNLSAPGIPNTFKEFLHKVNISNPTTVQMQSWPALLSGLNILAIAPTGSGKTFAYTLPMIPHILSQVNRNNNHKSVSFPLRPICLVIVPTRELCTQVSTSIKHFNKLFGIFNIAIYGGHDKDTQIDNIKQLNNRIDIVIATPGRLIDLMLTNIISLTSVTYLVIDEVDRMLALGFEQQLHIIFQYIRSDKQISLFSATFPGKLRESFSKWMNEDNSVTLRVNTIEMMSHTDFTGNVQSVAIHDSNQNGHGNDNDNEDMGVQKKMDSSNSEMKQQDQSNDEICNNNHNSNTSTLHDDKNVDNNTNNKSDITPSTNESLAPVDTTMLSITISSNVQQHIHVCVPHKKPRLLLRYLLKIQENDKILKLRNNSSVLIFCSKIKTILYLHKFLTNQNITCEKFYGTLDQNVREKVLSNFKAGKINILICTDIAARGIHIKKLKYVINYDFPSSIEQYCHRIGRAGRDGTAGTSYSFLTRNLACMSSDLVKLLQQCNQPIEPNLLKLRDDFESGFLSSFLETDENDEEEGDAQDDGGESGTDDDVCDTDEN